MNKPIVRDSFFLSKKSEKATKVDLPIAQDLEDTLKANRTVRYQDKKFEEHTQT